MGLVLAFDMRPSLLALKRMAYQYLIDGKLGKTDGTHPRPIGL